jgi:hypothetical protein
MWPMCSLNLDLDSSVRFIRFGCLKKLSVFASTHDARSNTPLSWAMDFVTRAIAKPFRKSLTPQIFEAV